MLLYVCTVQYVYSTTHVHEEKLQFDELHRTDAIDDLMFQMAQVTGQNPSRMSAKFEYSSRKAQKQGSRSA